jgi:hypothetical protein
VKQITNEEISKAMKTLPGDAAGFTDRLLDEFSTEQPALFHFANSRENLNKNELLLLLAAGQVAWYIIWNVLNLNPCLSWVFINEMSGRNSELFNEKLAGRNMDMDGLLDVFQLGNNQRCLMSFIMVFVADSVTKQHSLIRDEMVAVILMHVKTVIDCLVLDEDAELAETCEDIYSAKSFHSVQLSVMVYIDEFMRTPSFMKLTDYEKAGAVNIITAFSDMMYKRFLMLPVNWNARRAAECVARMPEEIEAEIEYFDAVEPVLMPFMDFCADKGYVPEGKNIAKRLDCLV